MPRVGKFLKTESRIEVPRGWNGREVGCDWLRNTVAVWDDEKVPEIMLWLHNIWNVHKVTKLYPYK